VEKSELVFAILTSITAIASAMAAVFSVRIAKSATVEQVLSGIRTQLIEADRVKNEKAVAYKIAHNKKTIKNEVLEIHRLEFESALQQLINIYDDACGTYLYGKINKKRFRLLFGTEIKQMVENPAHSEFYSGEEANNYKKTLKVYGIIKKKK